MAVLSFTKFATRVLRIALTLGQFVLARVAFDGCQIADLPPAQQVIAREMFGGDITVPELARDTLVLRCGRNSGKSTLSAADSLYAMLTADLSRVGPGDIPAVIVICPDKNEAQDTLNKARSMVENSPELAPLLVRSVAQGFHLLRPDGRLVRFLAIAKSGRGAAGRGKSIIQCIVDESEFTAPSDPSKVVRDVDIVQAITPRLMEGGKLILASTPWPAESLTQTLFEDNFGKPTTALAIRAPTLLMRDFDPFYVKKRDKLMLTDPGNAEREYDCIPRSAEGSFFDSDTIDRAVLYCAPTRLKATCGIDLGFKSDASAIVIVERQENLLAVTYLELDVPVHGAPLKPSTVCTKYANIARTFRCTELVADGHYIESAREAAMSTNMQVASGPSLTGDKNNSYLYLRDLLREGLVKLPNDPRLLTQLKSTMGVSQSGGGFRIIHPRKIGAGHADLVSALVNAAWMDRAKYAPLTGTKREAAGMMPSFVTRRNEGFVSGSVYGG